MRIGLPTWRLSHGIASPWIVPSNREPITRSSPAASRSTNGARSRSGYVSSASPITMYSPRATREAREVRAAVAGPLLADDDRAVLGGDLGGPVGRRVVDDDHLARPAGAPDPLERLVDDRADRVLLVQARDHHRDLGPGMNHYRTSRTAHDRSTCLVENRAPTPRRSCSPAVSAGGNRGPARASKPDRSGRRREAG